MPVSLQFLLFEGEWDDFEVDPLRPWLPPKKKQTQNSKPTPPTEAPADEVFGSWLFGDIRREVYNENIPEKDTPKETALKNALSNYLLSNNKDELNSFVPLLVSLLEKGVYERFLKVKSGFTWRLLVGLSKKQVEKLVGSTIKEEGVAEGVLLPPSKNSKFSSWSMSDTAMQRLFGQARLQGDSVAGYALLARCNTEGNTFFLNMNEVAPFLVVGETGYEYQKEVLAAGSVQVDKVAYVLVKDSNDNPVPRLLSLL
jgi:hypothetical protein